MDTGNEIIDWGLRRAFNEPRGATAISDQLGLQLDQASVMPTGKTAQDKCPTCFIIHTNIQTECW